MKRYIASTIILIFMTLTYSTIWGQSAWDAYRLSQQFNEGTARSVAMGNAMVALGGDIGALSINPASSGVYRYNELVFTPAFTFANSSTNYTTPDNGTFTTNESKTRFGIANFGYIGSFETGRRNSGLITWNIGLALNKVNNLTSRMSAAGSTAQSSWLGSLAQRTNGIISSSMDMNSSNNPFEDSRASWTSILGWNTSLLDNIKDSQGKIYDSEYKGATENLNHQTGAIYVGGELDQSYIKQTLGNVSEAVINFGGNISNKFFFGINLGLQSIWFEYNEVYSERAVNPSDFQSGFSSFSHSYRYNTSGTGVNLKAGFIYLPVKGLRLGASISTPTWMNLHEEWDERMSSQLKGTPEFPQDYSQRLVSPLGVYNYNLNTPFRWSVGAAYTFNKLGVISVDYESVNYSKMKLKDSDYHGAFRDENSYIGNNFTSSDIIRAGFEFKLKPEIALRGGYQYYSSGYKENNSTIQIGSLGLGYASAGGFFADIAYQHQFNKNRESFSLYDSILDENGSVISAAPVGTTESGTSKLLISLGFRF